MRHIWTVLCQKSIIDQESNNISMIDVVEQLSVMTEKTGEKPSQTSDDLALGATPAVIPFRLEVVTLWTRDSIDLAESQLSRMKIVSPSGKELFSAERSVDLTKHVRSRGRQISIGFPFLASEEGVYCFIIEKWDAQKEDFVEVSNVPLQVSITGK